MKKMTLGLGIAALLLVVLTGLLLAGTGPEDANSQPVKVELDDNFER